MAENEGVQNTKSQSDHEDIFQFIDRKIQEGEQQKIKTDLRNIIREEINKERQTRPRSARYSFNDTFERNLTVDDYKDKIISMLEGHIIFLEDEIRHKNTVIESFIQTNVLQGKGQNENFVSNSNKEITRKSTFLPTNLKSKNNHLEQADEIFQIPKRTSKNVQTKEGEAITLENRFDLLQINDEINESSDEKESNVVNTENITERKNKRKKNREKADDRRYVAIIGDSIVKEVKGHLLSTPKQNVVVKSFSGATIKQMYDYSKPTLEMKPDQLVIHVGTNDLKKTSKNDEIVDNIIDLALHCYRSNDIPVVISSLTHREDNFKDRIGLINEQLKAKCEERNIGYIDNSNIGKFHLNRSKLHLNAKGTATLAKNLKVVTTN